MSRSSDRRNTLALKRLQQLLDLDVDLLKYAEEWAEGFSAVSPSGGQSSGGRVVTADGHGDPLGNRVVADDEHPRADAGLAERCLALHADVITFLHTLSDLSYRARVVAPLAHSRADLAARQQEPRHWGAGECEACGRWVPGVDDDRLRSAFCRADYDAWRYAMKTHDLTQPPLDRVAWARARREALSSPDDGEDVLPGAVG